MTLRLTSSMYHRFHAPHDCRVDHVSYIPGDTWNVNPAALRRVEKLYCKNERAILRTKLSDERLTPSLWFRSGAVLVAGIRLHFIDVELCLRHRGAERRRLQRRVQEGRGDGMVRARLDHHRLCARRFLVLR